MHTQLKKFYDDGLKDCSWIPNTFLEFNKVYCKDLTIDYNDKALVLYSGNENFMYIDTIYVMKNQRGKGIATKLLSELSCRVGLICSHDKIDFYESLGFKKPREYTVMIKDNR